MGPRDEVIKRTTIRFPVRLHRWLRHWGIDHGDRGLEDTVIHALTEWARGQGYKEDAEADEESTDK